jgi:hypothetical protein
MCHNNLVLNKPAATVLLFEAPKQLEFVQGRLSNFFGHITSPEMEFLYISLTKESSLVLHAIHSPVNWRILEKNILFCYSGFKNL